MYYIFRDLPLTSIHPSALIASHVAHCAADQNAFWPMNERLFAGQEAREWGSSEREDYLVMVGYAQELGLDVVKLRSCVEENRSSRKIEADYTSATEQGFSSTPSFLINGQPFIGAQPYDAWKRAIDQVLGE